MRYLLVFSYDGGNFSGYQKQKDTLTIQEFIEEKLKILLKEDIKTYASGRTDSGVSAYKQYLHFDVKEKINDKGKFLYSLNALVAPSIYFIEMKEVDDKFHARYSAKEKTYVYYVNSPKYDLFARHYSFFYHYKIDFSLLRKALSLFIGTHNFQNFTTKEEDENNFVRTINSIKIENVKENLFLIKINGNGFMRYMVRMIVMTALEVSSNRFSLEKVKQLLESNDREIVSLKAPANALFLLDVKY